MAADSANSKQLLFKWLEPQSIYNQNMWICGYQWQYLTMIRLIFDQYLLNNSPIFGVIIMGELDWIREAWYVHTLPVDAQYMMKLG